MPRVVVVSPPFLSHARPLSVLASALRSEGADVWLACAPSFAALARAADLSFASLTVTRNANTGIAERTRQESAESARLREFLTATRRGALATLLAQAAHRRADMLPDPERVLADLSALHERLRPDWYLVDQLSYSATLALHCLGLPFASYCPGHPTYLPATPDAYFGVPYAWPAAIRPDQAEHETLLTAARANDAAFTRLFATFTADTAPHRPPPARAFALTSPTAVVHNYPELPWLPPAAPGPAQLSMGNCVADSADIPPADALTEHWKADLARITATGRPLVLAALGTFLSHREDILRMVARGLLEHTGAGVVMAAGKHTEAVREELAARIPQELDRILLADSVPQTALLADSRTRAMVHHGGNNSFTECVRAGVPAVLLPFASDQFAIAHDAERAGVGSCLDPMTLTPRGLGSAVRRLLDSPPPGLPALTARVRARGPRWAAARLTEAMRTAR